METDELLQLLCNTFGDVFHGVFARDEFHRVYNYLQHQNHRPAAFIVNTDDRSRPGEHWVAYYITHSGVVECFDSFGHDPRMYGLPKANIFNSVQVQAFTSVHCGLFATYFLLARAHNIPMHEIVRQFSLSPALLMRNDCLVAQYIMRMLKQ